MRSTRCLASRFDPESKLKSDGDLANHCQFEETNRMALPRNERESLRAYSANIWNVMPCVKFLKECKIYVDFEERLLRDLGETRYQHILKQLNNFHREDSRTSSYVYMVVSIAVFLAVLSLVKAHPIIAFIVGILGEIAAFEPLARLLHRYNVYLEDSYPEDCLMSGLKVTR